jgi:myosin-5
LKELQPRDPDTQPHGTDDMTTLSYLSEPGVLYNLKCRYGVDEIYVSIPEVVFICRAFVWLEVLKWQNS